ncbi:hypothetical protein TWF192_000353 [Orbilia oligospora]|uniref:Uncharacterized protein n=1 Tax=Orbilia oligospora TaxID=2813651 RepID=A0A6G1MHS9_ORBOL|nr:hypothetical protein TWF679_005732 [Orbilia oligospora]KAF3213689.1 hypothetical protein TWF191_009987 [Orbilia oligospora]KAF3258217.1 hypothetical protein TWF192_000353 [Orbilia oligospora]
MKACSLSLLKIALAILWALLIDVPSVCARRITTKQVQKAPPDDMLLEHDYEVTEDDMTVDVSVQRWTDTSTEWMDDGCINLEESGDDWLLEQITYNPARVNPSYPYFLDGILVFNEYFCQGVPLELQLGDFTDERDLELGSPWNRPWEDPKNGAAEEGHNLITFKLKKTDSEIKLRPETLEEIRLPDTDLPEELRPPLKEKYTDEVQFDIDTATNWHKASAWRGMQHIKNISKELSRAEAEEEQKWDDVERDELFQNENDWHNQIGEFGRDISLHGFWGAVSIKVVTDQTHWYTTNLQREVL